MPNTPAPPSFLLAPVVVPPAGLTLLQVEGLSPGMAYEIRGCVRFESTATANCLRLQFETNPHGEFAVHTEYQTGGSADRDTWSHANFSVEGVQPTSVMQVGRAYLAEFRGTYVPGEESCQFSVEALATSASGEVRALAASFLSVTPVA